MPRRILLLCVLALLAPAAANAAVAVTGFGPRIGISSNPDQVVFGGQMQIGDIAPSLTFDPGLEFGFGDDVTTIAFNFDLKYHFALQTSQWKPYVGLGIGVDIFSFDLPPPLRDESITETGGNAIIGVGVPTRAGSNFFTEARVGIGDLPDLKIMAGWNFHR